MRELEKTDELVDDAIHKMNQFMERYHQRLSSDNLRLAERYIKGELRLHVHFRQCLFPENYCAILHGENFSWKGLVPRERPVCGGKMEANLACADSDNSQEAVLVEVVKLMKSPEVVVTSLVRFGRVDELYRGAAHSLYFSRARGYVFLDRLANRIAASFGGSLPVGKDQLVSQVVQGASQIVGCVSGDGGESMRNVGGDAELPGPVSSLRIVLSDDVVWASFKEGACQDFKITDVLFGPFDFQPDAMKLF